MCPHRSLPLQKPIGRNSWVPTLQPFTSMNATNEGVPRFIENTDEEYDVRYIHPVTVTAPELDVRVGKPAEADVR